MELLAKVNFSASPSDAPQYVKKNNTHILLKKGGEGVFREFVESLILENIPTYFETFTYPK